MVKGLNVGDLDKEFTIQQPVGLDGDGYADVETGVWGSKRFANGSELLRFGTPTATGTYVIAMRYRDDLQASWRLVEEETGRTFQVSSFGDLDGSGEQVTIFCLELQ